MSKKKSTTKEASKVVKDKYKDRVTIPSKVNKSKEEMQIVKKKSSKADVKPKTDTKQKNKTK